MLETAFDSAFCLRTRGDEMRDAQGGEGALEFGPRFAAIGGRFVAKKGQSVGVKGQGTAMAEKSTAEVLEMMPCGVDGN